MNKSEPPSITCPQCGATSYNLNDIEHRYCGRCHRFHDDPFDKILNDCLYCCGVEFELGPRGGASRNITCIGCGARFNIVDHPGVPRFLVNVLSGPAP
jgi:hypothetical protein